MADYFIQVHASARPQDGAIYKMHGDESVKFSRIVIRLFDAN